MAKPRHTRSDPKTKTITGQESAKFREGVESIVIAIVLAFLFRAFEAEAFVIPTGSMAPTLQGRHKDLTCPACGHRYRTGDSLDESRQRIAATVCPMCFYKQEMDVDDSGRLTYRGDHVSQTGDRILVNKFAYEKPFGDPRRWDVIVFKFPGNAKQNYIKRLVGLPNETIRVYHGDVYFQKKGETEFQIARKPPDKLAHMLQLVNDSRYIPLELTNAGYPSNWRTTKSTEASWSTIDGGKSFSCIPTGAEEWIQYQHAPPSFDQWERIPRDEPAQAAPILITDFYTYNAAFPGARMSYYGNHWVGDLALDCQVEVIGDEGNLMLELIEAGRHHRCAIDVESGTARLEIDGGRVPFNSVGAEAAPSQLTGSTRLKGPGRYTIRFANVDNQLTLWVNNRVCDFGHPATYTVDSSQEMPVWSAADAGDLAPVRIGASGLKADVRRLQVLRDVYYVAQNRNSAGHYGDYDRFTEQLWFRALTNPAMGAQDLFPSRRYVDFELKEDQFFPMGDNSPMSKDARLWSEFSTIPHYVERDMLIGKAVFVYWPHPCQIKVPFINKTLPIFPNFKDMKLIH